MSFIIRAPHPSVQTTTILPSPQFGDTISLVADLSVKRSVNSETYTYIRDKSKERLLTFDWRLTREKALELRAFVESYHSSKIHILDHKGRQWVTYLVVDGAEFNTFGRWTGVRESDVADEAQDIQLQFRTVT